MIYLMSVDIFTQFFSIVLLIRFVLFVCRVSFYGNYDFSMFISDH